MIVGNLHTHSFFSDGSDSPEKYADSARSKYMKVLGMSTHAPLPFKTNWCIDEADFERYCYEVDQLMMRHRPDLLVFCGIEADYIPGLIGPSNFRLPNIDYIIGSIHFLDQFPDGKYWNIDSKREIFMRGLKEIFDNNIKKALEKYFQVIVEMAEYEKPDIIGHLDKIKIHNINNELFNPEDKWYKDLVFDTLKSISKTDCIVEVNTRGFYKKNGFGLYPSDWIIREMRNLNIKITVSADAHNPSEVDAGFDYAEFILSGCGYNEYWMLSENTEWRTYPIDH